MALTDRQAAMPCCVTCTSVIDGSPDLPDAAISPGEARLLAYLSLVCRLACSPIICVASVG